MRTAAVRPTGQERSFGEHELIVTKTDLKGVITYANPVFQKVSSVTEAEAVGRPHNIIRHPDMPAGVFKLLWDSIQAGDEVFAYVLNLARDGAHYWVLAHVTPSFDRAGRIVGYHSSRRRPDRSAIAAVGPLYAAMRAEERRHSRAGEAAAAGLELLLGRLDGEGRTYDEFVWSPAGGLAPSGR
ncbi:PAS domain-containing protein [Dactylosporangium sp. NPDC000244]|uniref:PAS domain-containing protein n=1 Tax=Dactylosporangium sp. NPDC000244 TaxID=3154365 RepID=UPI003332CDB3